MALIGFNRLDKCYPNRDSKQYSRDHWSDILENVSVDDTVTFKPYNLKTS